jgi:lantibiotic biosynthesis protein
MPKPQEYQYFDSAIFRIPTLCYNRPINVGKYLIDTQTLNTTQEFLEGLFLASPTLFNEIEKYSTGLLTGNALLKFQISILKYYSRLTIRCTPFGLFAGCGVAEVGEASGIIPVSIKKFRSSTRLDMNYLCTLIQDISKKEEIRDQANYYPNSSLYSSGINFRYTEFNFIKTQRKYTLTEAKQNVYLQKILESASRGKKIEELSNLLVDNEITFEEAKEFINELIDNQILISNFETAVTGKELLPQFVEKLETLSGTTQLVNNLKEIDKLLHGIDSHPIGRPVSHYQNIKEKLGKFTAKFDEKELFQSDLYVPAEKAIIGKPIIEAAQKAIAVFCRFTPKLENPLLKKFREDFYKKYEEQEIPLAQVLDVETGIGFGNIEGQKGDISSLLEGLRFTGKATSSQNVKINQVQELLIKKYEDFLQNRTHEIEITDIDVKGLLVEWGDLPNTISAMIEVIHTEKSPDGPLIILKHSGGSSAANLLGRFCYLDKKIQKFVKDIVQKEKDLNPDKILAEIVHLPESRIGNILMRPTLREYEIPYLANTSVESSNVISITDIMVSVPLGRYIKLRSEKLNKEVLPRLTCAHNFSNNALPIYQFLCTMQTQGLRGSIGFNWGSLMENKPFLPRVRYQNTIFSSAIWNISSEDIKKIPGIRDNLFFEKVAEFKKGKKIPDKVFLVQGDNKLLIDFNHPLSVQMLFSEVKKRGFRLEEFLFVDKYPLVKRGDEVFTNQVILCFYKIKREGNG